MVCTLKPMVLVWSALDQGMDRPFQPFIIGQKRSSKAYTEKSLLLTLSSPA